MNKEYDKALSRLAIIIHKLSNDERPSKDDLAIEFNVHERTIRRDIKDRLKYFPIEVDELNRYKFIDGFSLSKTTFENDELLMAFLGLSQLKNINENFDKTIDNLINKLFHPGYNSIFHIKQENYEHLDLNSTVYEELEFAIKRNMQTIINTRNQDINIHPYKLLNIDGIWYLLAKDLIDSKIKSYLLSKIIKVNATNKTFSKVKDLDEVISNVHSGFFEDGNSFEVKVKIYKEIAHYFKIKSFLPTQNILKEYDDKSLVVSFEVSHYEDIDNIIKSWLPHIEVLEPIEYKNKIQQELQNYLKNLTQTINKDF